ncbi:MAG: exosortase K [Proteobacteria bacterium]|nr:exosortase K [Pseudomonadota bacterium]
MTLKDLRIRGWRPNFGDVFLIMVVLLLAGVLKYHFSRATSDDLAWILRPLAFAVEKLTDLSFHRESGAGYISNDGLIIIAPVCAGVNFLIAVLLTGAGTVIMTPSSFGQKCLRLALVLVSAYLFTLMVNTLRIILAIELYRMDIYGDWLTAERMHRVAGILLYFPALLWYGLVFQRLFSGKHSSPIIACCLFWYLGLSLGVPLLTGSFQNSGIRFYEHGFTLVIICGLTAGGYHWLTGGWGEEEKVMPCKRSASFWCLKLTAGPAKSGVGKTATSSSGPFPKG